MILHDLSKHQDKQREELNLASRELSASMDFCLVCGATGVKTGVKTKGPRETGTDSEGDYRR